MTNADAIPSAPLDQMSALARARWIVWGGLMPVHILLLGWLACCLSPTADEIAHLAAGVRIWTTGQFDLYQVNPPLVKIVAAVPVVLDPPTASWKRIDTTPGARSEWLVGSDYLWENPTRFGWDFVIARWACIPFSLLGLEICFRWGTRAFGVRSGLLAASLWCFSPNILGNACLITPDVAAAALFAATLYLFRSWLLTPGWSRAFAVGFCWGLAELCKMTCLILYVCLPLLWMVTRQFRRGQAWGLLPAAPSDDPSGEHAVSSTPVQLAQLLLMVFLSVDIINAGYLFEGTGRPLEAFEFVSQALRGSSIATVGNRFRDGPLAAVPVPMPAAWIIGLDLQRRDFEGGWKALPSYLRGELRQGGWWYYYLYGFLVKVPLGTWLIGGCAAAAAILKKGGSQNRFRWELVVLLLPAGCVLLAVSSQTGFSRYFRYVLPVFPFMFIALSSVWEDLHGTPSRKLSTLAGVGLLCMIGESMAVYPNSLGYFNLAAGGPLQGHRHLLDSNVDWGQDLYRLNDWMIRHPEARPLYVGCSSVADLRLMLRDFRPIEEAEVAAPEALRPGWYAISANRLHEYDEGCTTCARFLQLTPIAHAGSSISIYHVRETTD